MQAVVLITQVLPALILAYLVVPAVSVIMKQAPCVVDLVSKVALVVAVDTSPTFKFVPTEATALISNIVSVKAPAFMPNLAVEEVSSNLSEIEAFEALAKPPTSNRVSKFPPILPTPTRVLVVSMVKTLVDPAAFWKRKAVVELALGRCCPSVIKKMPETEAVPPKAAEPTVSKSPETKRSFEAVT